MEMKISVFISIFLRRRALCYQYRSLDTGENYKTGGRCGRDRMIVGFTATCVISAYHH